MIYFDNNATTPIDKEVQAALINAVEIYGNPSSIHEAGQKAKQIIDDAREKVATLIGAFPDEIVFTSGGTEANNLAVLGCLEKIKTATTSKIEHSSVLNTFKYLERKGVAVSFLKTDENGLTILDDAIIKKSDFISMMLVNNDTGVKQPVSYAVEKARASGTLFHTDAVQALGKTDINAHELGVDLMSLSAHKIYAPKGVGALFVKRGVKLNPIMFGGSQEKLLRPGTESSLLICAFGKACEIAMSKAEEAEKLKKLTILFEEELQKQISNITINGLKSERVQGTTNVTFGGLKGDLLVINLDLAGLCASGGSACSAADFKPSQTLLAMGKTEEEASSSVRFSMGKDTTAEEVFEAVAIVRDTVSAMRAMTW